MITVVEIIGPEEGIEYLLNKVNELGNSPVFHLIGNSAGKKYKKSHNLLKQFEKEFLKHAEKEYNGAAIRGKGDILNTQHLDFRIIKSMDIPHSRGYHGAERINALVTKGINPEDIMRSSVQDSYDVIINYSFNSMCNQYSTI